MRFPCRPPLVPVLLAILIGAPVVVHAQRDWARQGAISQEELEREQARDMRLVTCQSFVQPLTIAGAQSVGLEYDPTTVAGPATLNLAYRSRDPEHANLIDRWPEYPVRLELARSAGAFLYRIVGLPDGLLGNGAVLWVMLPADLKQPARLIVADREGRTRKTINMKRWGPEQKRKSLERPPVVSSPREEPPLGPG